MVILTLTEKGGEAKQLTFEKDEVTVGRVQGNDIVLPKGNVSKRHCRIFLQQGAFVVEDYKSTNGTYVNGRKIGETTSINGADKIYVGDFIIKIENAPGAGAASVPPLNEAGSLSTAIPRRAPTPPPPPPPSARSSGVFRTETETREPSARSSGSRATLPPPPPPLPAPRRESNVAALPSEPATQESLDDLDDEPLAARPPKLSVPPLRSRLTSLSDDGDEDGTPPAPIRTEGLPATPSGASADALATWLKSLLEAADVSAVFVTGPTSVEVERRGRREPAARLDADAPLTEALRTLALRANPGLGQDAPVIDVLLADGSRVTAVLPPLASVPSAALRRGTAPGTSLGDLASQGMVSVEMQQALEAILATRRNILVSGDGLTAKAFATVLAAAAPAGFRIVTVADGVPPPEGGASAWVALTPDRGRPELLATAAALAPDYLIVTVGDAVEPADALLQAALGPSGVIAVLPARSGTDALLRLYALAGPVIGGAASGRELVQGAFDVVVQIGVLADGTRKCLEIAEPKLERDGSLRAETLFSFRSEVGPDGRPGGRFESANLGASRLSEVLASRGASLAGAGRR